MHRRQRERKNNVIKGVKNKYNINQKIVGFILGRP